MNKKKILIAVACVVAFVLLAVITVKDLQGDYGSSVGNTNMTRPTWPSDLEEMVQNRPTHPGQDGSVPSQSDISEDSDQTSSTKSEEKDEWNWNLFQNQTQDDEQDTANAAQDQSQPDETGPSLQQTQPTEPDSVPPELNQPAKIAFPHTIADTALVVQTLSPYTGVFLEDGSDVNVENMATIVLSNESDVCVEYAEITLTAEDGSVLRFVVSGMDPGSMAVVMEAGCAVYEEKEYISCSAQLAETAAFSMSEEMVSVQEDEDGALLVKNISGADIPCVRVFYKFYMESMNAYVGGITYTAKITDLAAGETRTVMPSHYAAGYSKVIMVRTYETAD